jgi:hypothetical protein
MPLQRTGTQRRRGCRDDITGYTVKMTRFVRSVAVLLVVLTPALARASDLRVTDTSGTQVIVRNATLDYAAGIAAVRESDGIRVLQGEGTVTVKWTDIDLVTVLRPGDAGKDDKMTVEVQLRNGRRVTATLTRVHDTKLRGRTELGDYAIDVDKVRSIEPLR